MESGSVTVKRKAVRQLQVLKRKEACKEWIEQVTNIELGPADEFEKDLRDGLILIELINKLKPEILDMSKVHYKCKTIANTEDTFKMIENISLFIDAAMKYDAFASSNAFSPIDLINGENIGTLLECILAVKHKSESAIEEKPVSDAVVSGSKYTKPLADEKPVDEEKKRGLKRLASMPKKDLLALLNDAGIRHEKDVANMQDNFPEEDLPEPPKNLCIICKKPTSKTTKTGSVYYHKNCLFCNKCGIYFIKKGKRGWYWNQRFYCMGCIKKSATRMNKKLEEFT